jgi:hypothetical protein
MRSHSSTPAEQAADHHHAATSPAAGVSTGLLPSHATSLVHSVQQDGCDATRCKGSSAAAICTAAPYHASVAADVIPTAHATLDVLGRNAPDLISNPKALAPADVTNYANDTVGYKDSDRQELGPLSWTAIARLNWRLCVAVFVLYACTLSIFPGFLAGKGQQQTLSSAQRIQAQKQGPY